MKWSNIHSSHPDPDVPPVDIVATGGNTMDHKIGTVTTHYFDKLPMHNMFKHDVMIIWE